MTSVSAPAAPSASVPGGASIGVVAARFGLDTHVLRHWEDAGLLEPARDSAGRRRYSEADAVRIAIILCSKASGMTLGQIGNLMRTPRPGRNAVLRAHLSELDQRIQELERARDMAEHALHCRHRDVGTCPRFRVHAEELSIRPQKAAANAN